MRSFVLAAGVLVLTACGGTSADVQTGSESSAPTDTGSMTPSTPAETSASSSAPSPVATGTLSGTVTRSGGYSAVARAEFSRPSSMRLGDNDTALDVVTDCGPYDPNTTAVLFEVTVSGQDTTGGGFSWPAGALGTLTLQSTETAPQPQLISDAGDCAGGNQLSIPLGQSASAFVVVSGFFSPDAPEGNPEFLKTLRARLATGFAQCATEGTVLAIDDPGLCVAAVQG